MDSSTVSLVQVAVLAGFVLVIIRFATPRSGAVLPCRRRTTTSPCPNHTAVRVAASQAPLLFAIAVIGWALFKLANTAPWPTTVALWLAIILASRCLSQRSGLRELGSASRLGYADLIWVCLGATALMLYAKFSLPAVAVHLGIVGLILWKLPSRRRALFVRIAAGIAAASAGYVLLLGLVGTPVLVPLAAIAALAVSFVAARFVFNRLRGRRFVRLLASVGSALFGLVFGFGLVLAAMTPLMVWGGWVERGLNRTVLRVSYPSSSSGFPDPLEPPLEVAKAYEPFWVLSRGERWPPVLVDTYLAEAKLFVGRRPAIDAAGIVTGEVHDAISACEPGQVRCVLTIKCEHAGLDCAENPPSSQSGVYARVVDDPLTREKLDPALLRGRLSQLRRLVQYWVFHHYDDWTATPLGWIRQWHEADWEWVSVGLGPKGPLFVAFSSHCGGSVRRWSDVSAIASDGRTPDDALQVARPLQSGSHPLAFVARGSHATYPNAWPHAPDWKGCRRKLPVYDFITWGPTHAVGARESMRYHEDLRDAIGPPIILVDETTPFMSYRGYWGRADHLRYLWRGSDCDAEDGGESCHPVPDTPSVKDAWTAPLCTMFCDEYWEAPEPCPWPSASLGQRHAPCI